MMKSIGSTLLLLGVGSIALHIFDYNFTILSWINHWGEAVGWGIRGALVFAGGSMVILEWLAGDDSDENSGYASGGFHADPLDSSGGPADLG